MCGRNIQVNLVPILLLSPFPTIPLWAPGTFIDHLAETLSNYTKNRTGFGASFPELATVRHTEEGREARFIIREGGYDERSSLHLELEWRVRWTGRTTTSHGPLESLGMD